MDFEGETIDYAGGLDPFDVKVTAAHWQLVLAEVAGSRLGVSRQITVRAHRKSYIVRQLQPEYALVLVLHPRAAFAASHRALQEAEARLCAEAGWSTSRTTRWYCVDVETEASDRGRPARLRGAGGWQPVEVMGSMVASGRARKRFRSGCRAARRCFSSASAWAAGRRRAPRRPERQHERGDAHGRWRRPEERAPVVNAPRSKADSAGENRSEKYLLTWPVS